MIPPVVPKTTLPGVVTCTVFVTVLLPDGMLNEAPPVILVVGVPVDVIVPVDPLVWRMVQAASAQAFTVTIVDRHVMPLAELLCIS